MSTAEPYSHRLETPGEMNTHLIEVQAGDYFGEDDIERFEDIYGRMNPHLFTISRRRR